MPKKKKELSFEKLQAKNLKCPFCGKSNKKHAGGYFRQCFICDNCLDEIKQISGLLEGHK